MLAMSVSRAGFRKQCGVWTSKRTSVRLYPQLPGSQKTTRSRLIVGFRGSSDSQVDMLLNPGDFAVYEADFDGKITNDDWKQAAVAWAKAWVPTSALIALMIAAQLRSLRHMEAQAAAQAAMTRHHEGHEHLQGADKYKHMAYSSWKNVRIKLGLRQPDPVMHTPPSQSPYRMLVWQLAALGLASSLMIIAATTATIINLPRNIKIAAINKLTNMDGMFAALLHNGINSVYQSITTLLFLVMRVRAGVYGKLHTMISMLANTILHLSTTLHRISMDFAARRHTSNNLAESVLKLEQFRRGLLESSDDVTNPVTSPRDALRMHRSTLLIPQTSLPLPTTGGNAETASSDGVNPKLGTDMAKAVKARTANNKAGSNGKPEMNDHIGSKLQFEIRYADLHDEPLSKLGSPSGLLIRISHPASGKALPAFKSHIPVPSQTSKLRGGSDDVPGKQVGSFSGNGDGVAAGSAAINGYPVGKLDALAEDDTIEHVDLLGLADQISMAAKDYASLHTVPLKELLVEVDFQD